MGSKAMSSGAAVGLLTLVAGAILGACGGDEGVEALAGAKHSPPPSEAAQSRSMSKELRAAYIAAVQAEAPPAYAAVDDGADLVWMDNPAHSWVTTLDRGSLVIGSIHSPWSFTMWATGVGCEGATTTLPESEPEVEGNRVRYHRGGVEERYVNGRLGVEQAFELSAPPACAGPKVITMQIAGDLAATLDDNDDDGRGDAVRFVDVDRRAALLYSDLYVKDAAGKSLSAWLSVNAGEVKIHVDDEGAVYPVVVDPLIGTDERRLLPVGAEGDDKFGSTVAVDGDTALVSAPYDDDDHPDAGAVYVFVRSDASTWALQAKLGAPDGPYNSLDSPVALSGNTALVSGSNASGDAVFVFTRTGVTWTQQATLTPPIGTEASCNFGFSVALHNDTALVGAPWLDVPGKNDAGATFAFARMNGTWSPQGMLTASIGDQASIDSFGASVAVLGDTALIGSPQIPSNGGSVGPGKAFVFTRSGSSWSQKIRLDPGGLILEDLFGSSVALSQGTALVGAPGKDFDKGAVYVFTGAGSVWSLQTTLVANDGVAGDEFGHSVAIFGDIALAGAPGRDVVGNGDVGAAYLFERINGTWNYAPQKLFATDWAKNDQFGRSVAISGGNAFVGAPLHDHEGVDTGSAYWFEYTGINWPQKQEFLAKDGPGDSAFGASVAVWGDTALVGDPEDDEKGFLAGAVYAFTKDASGAWSAKPQRLIADGASDFWRLGTSVALWDNTALVGGAGAAKSVYVFERDAAGVWSQTADTLTIPAIPGDGFGASVALSAEAALVGAHSENAPNKADVGAAYVFRRNAGGGWNLSPEKLTAGDGQQNDQFGYSVALSGDTAIIGTFEAEAAYVFVWDGMSFTFKKKLIAFDASSGRFGSAVAVSGDIAIVGSYANSNGNGSSAGAAYLFERDAQGEWNSIMPKLLASDGAVQDKFGLSVAISGDVALVGAPGHDDVIKGADVGSVYVFRRVGGAWEQSQLLPSNGDAGYDFGTSVVISGYSAVVGAPDSSEAGPFAGAVYSYLLTGPNGSRCVDGDACDSTYCSDGVCCDAACAGSCDVCALARGADKDGVCTVLPEGAAPDDDCPTYVCDGASGLCPTTCDGNADCANKALCDSKNTCVTELDDGNSCNTASQCKSGFCVDGVCCDQACTEVCRACAAARNVKGIDGVCDYTKAGVAPSNPNHCIAQPEETCSLDGTCNGAGSCAMHGSDVICGAQQCNGSVVSAQTCSGAGECTTNVKQVEDCDPYGCADGECKASCAVDGDCASDVYRCTDGQCKPKATYCQDEHTLVNADGTETDCQSYRCNGNVCMQTCTSIDDCSGSNECDVKTHQCVARPAISSAVGDCACRAAGAPAGSSPWPAALAAALIFSRRRRSRA